MKEAAKRIKEARFVVALTGAGISTESGIPDFRSKNGLWSKYDINEYGYLDSFLRKPGKVWKMIAEMISNFSHAKPNAAHYAMAEMEKMSILKGIITQNIDNLHQEAGSKNVIELHGNYHSLTCMKCGRKYSIDEIELSNLPPLCSCNGVIKPDIVFFGETLPRNAVIKAFDLTNRCDVMLVVGTSCAVSPAAELPLIAKQNGATIIEINMEESMISHVADYQLMGKAGELLPRLLNEIKNLP